MHHNTMHRCSTPANNIVQCQLILNNSKQNIILVMTMIFFPISKVLPFRDFRISLFQRQNFFPETFASLIVAFLNFVSLQMLYLYLFPSLHAFSPSLAHSQSRTQPSTHNSSVHSLAHATRSRTPGLAHQGERMVPTSGRLVGGDEPGSSALSPDIHTQWVHSHTCLIAWPIGGGALWGWRPL